MKLIHLRAEQINGSLVTVDGADEASFDEVATLVLPNGEKRTGRVVKIEGDSVTLQVFEGSRADSEKYGKQVRLHKKGAYAFCASTGMVSFISLFWKHGLWYAFHFRKRRPYPCLYRIYRNLCPSRPRPLPDEPQA